MINTVKCLNYPGFIGILNYFFRSTTKPIPSAAREITRGSGDFCVGVAVGQGVYVFAVDVLIGVAVVAVVGGAVAESVGVAVGSTVRVVDTVVVLPDVTLNRCA